jgi:hypothetical protein
MASFHEPIVARLGTDLNWWVAPDPGAEDVAATPLGVLDPRQVQVLADLLPGYSPYGLTARQVADAFRAYSLAGELDEGLVRLTPLRGGLLDAGDSFAVPAIETDGDSPYYDFLEALSLARVRRLNETRHYAQDCTVDDLRGELDVLDQDRYFSADAIHPFDEVNEILEWHPADWDEP